MRGLLICLLLFVGTAFAQPNPQSMITKVITLHYIQAEALIPQLKPLLVPGEIISGEGSSLIVKVLPDTLTQLRVVIHDLDSAPVVLNVTIHQGSDQWLRDQQQNEVVYGTNSASKAGNVQSVQVLSGGHAFISMSNDRPVISSVSGGWYPSVSYAQKQEKQGFLIEPVLQGEQVTIKIGRIRQQVNPVNNQASMNQNLETTSMVPLGKWVKLGAADQSDVITQPSETTYEAVNTFTNEASLYIKVDRVK